MRLKVKTSSGNVHTELVGSLGVYAAARLKLELSNLSDLLSQLSDLLPTGWNVWNELFTCSDDQTIQKWNPLGEPEGKV